MESELSFYFTVNLFKKLVPEFIGNIVKPVLLGIDLQYTFSNNCQSVGHLRFWGKVNSCIQGSLFIGFR
jgi:hypothetical protein